MAKNDTLAARDSIITYLHENMDTLETDVQGKLDTLATQDTSITFLRREVSFAVTGGKRTRKTRSRNFESKSPHFLGKNDPLPARDSTITS